ncbi:MAG: hypothetical protein K9N52_05585 [Verrucomicrobia bacterium]|nr:hypothetical protein [Verrucomicrobiota bacterium]
MYNERDFLELRSRLISWIESYSDRELVDYLKWSAYLSDECFNRFATGIFRLQFGANPEYRRYCESAGIRDGVIQRWEEIPSMPVSGFGMLDLTCLPERERTACFLSSGTTRDTRGRHFHSTHSLELYETSLKAWFRFNLEPGAGMSRDKKRYLILSPPAVEFPSSSLVYMLDTVRRHFGAGESIFAGYPVDDAGWALETRRILEFLEAASDAGAHLTILGTAFSYVNLLDEMERRGVKFGLPRGTCAMETGGYKGRSREVPRNELHKMISARLGIERSSIVSEYGMCELSSQAYDKSMHPDSKDIVSDSSTLDRRVFRFPPWTRIRVISPETGDAVEDGGVGLLCVYDLANLYSALAVQTEDLVIRRSAGFEFLGRTSTAAARGCSLLQED